MGPYVKGERYWGGGGGGGGHMFEEMMVNRFCVPKCYF